MLAPLECASRTILQEQQCQVSKVDMENASKGTLLFSAVCETKLFRSFSRSIGGPQVIARENPVLLTTGHSLHSTRIKTHLLSLLSQLNIGNL